MAEVIAALGVIASVAQLADYGFKLSVKLYTFSEAVSSADKSIKAMSSDVSLTSTVLKELCIIIESDKSRVVSEGALTATAETVKECLVIFEQLNKALDKSMEAMGLLELGEGKKRVKRGTVALERLKWPFKQPKMELLRSNLDRMKASLTLMLQVLCYAKDVSSRRAAETSLAYQQQMIESLARSEKVMRRKYVALQKALEYEEAPPVFNATINAAVHVTTERNLDALDATVEMPAFTTSKIKSTVATVESPPDVKPRTLVAELLLCFQLLNDLLGYHSIVSRHMEITLSPSSYAELGRMLEMILNEKHFHDSPLYEKSEAARNLQLRIKEILQSRYLKPRQIIHTTESRQQTPAATKSDHKVKGSQLVKNTVIFTGPPQQYQEDPVEKKVLRKTIKSPKEKVRKPLEPYLGSESDDGIAIEFADTPVDHTAQDLRRRPDGNTRPFGHPRALDATRQEKERLFLESLSSSIFEINKIQDENDKVAKTLRANDVATEEMRQNLLRVLEGGERLTSIRSISYDTLNSTTEKRPMISISAGSFREQAMRQQESPWKRALEAVSGAGYEGMKVVQDAGARLFAGANKIVETVARDKLNGDEHENDKNEDGNDDESDDQDIVARLLSRWTTLPI